MSETARAIYAVPENLKHLPGRIYVVTFGVNRFSDTSINPLNYAVKDVRDIQHVVKQAFSSGLGDQSLEVINIPLVSDRINNRQWEAEATKQNLSTTLQLLAGQSVSKTNRSKIPGGNHLKPATPNDVVLVFIATHGVKTKDGDFYLFPTEGKGLKQPITLISNHELTRWLQDIDGGELALILDACNSAASVEGLDFKPGPFAKSGLGRLAYDKGFRVLLPVKLKNTPLRAERLKTVC